MTYLFWAFAFVWLAFFTYNAYLVKKAERLEREIQQLKSFVAERVEAWKNQPQKNALES